MAARRFVPQSGRYERVRNNSIGLLREGTRSATDYRAARLIGRVTARPRVPTQRAGQAKVRDFFETHSVQNKFFCTRPEFLSELVFSRTVRSAVCVHNSQNIQRFQNDTNIVHAPRMTSVNNQK